MNKKRIGIIILVILLMGVIYYFTTDKAGNENIPNNLPEDITQEIDGEADGGEDKGTDIVKEAREIGIDKEAPNFTLKGLDGEEVSLEDYRGKIVLINFWATWCGFCDAEMPDIQKLSEENDDLVVLGVDVMEDKKLVEEYIEEGGYDFPILLDEDGEVSRTYLVSGLPTSYFLDENGILLKRVPGMMNYEYMNQILDEIRGEK